jgi:hypothetical protein
MNDQESQDSSSSVGQLARLVVSPSSLAVFVVIASLLVGGFSFMLTRPVPERILSHQQTDALNPESRMWQDPSELISIDKLNDPAFTQRALTESEQHWAELRQKVAALHSKRQAVIVVVGNSSSSPFGTEMRLRNRVAVLSALQAAGLVKENSSRTLFVLHEAQQTEAQSGPTFLLPVETFSRDPLLERGSDGPPENLPRQ